MDPISLGTRRIRSVFAAFFAATVMGLGPCTAWGQQVASELAEGIFLISGLGSNVLAVTAPDGVLLIDNGHSRSVESLNAQIAALDSGPVRAAINTHFHFDHVGGNEALGRAGATIMGHRNCRERMRADWVVPQRFGIRWPRVPPYPEVALPALTFDRALQFHFGEHDIEALHFPNAHSDADIAVFLRDANVLHTGDLYLSNGFPIIDSFHGGSIDGQLAALDGLIALIDEGTIVVPGHGPVSDRGGLQAYRTMLSTGRDRIFDLISQGLTLEEVVEADPTAGLYAGGDSWLDPKVFVWTVFVDLTGGGSGS